LEGTFRSTHYPDVIQRELLAKRIRLKEERIEVEYQLVATNHFNVDILSHL
jgi:hypothetical protein